MLDHGLAGDFDERLAGKPDGTVSGRNYRPDDGRSRSHSGNTFLF
jgi:hypothetical protein